MQLHLPIQTRPVVRTDQICLPAIPERLLDSAADRERPVDLARRVAPVRQAAVQAAWVFRAHRAALEAAPLQVIQVHRDALGQAPIRTPARPRKRKTRTTPSISLVMTSSSPSISSSRKSSTRSSVAASPRT